MSNVTFARAGRFVLDVLYPPSCALCKTAGAFLCDRCEASLPCAGGERCERCWLPLQQPHCERAFAFTALRSCYRYGGDVRKLIYGLKFSRRSSLAEPLGERLGALIQEHDLDADGLVPVPLPRARRHERGYNQAAELAKAAGRSIALPVLDVLERVNTPSTQARAATAEQRWRNVQGIFGLKRGANVGGRNLLLVDDIATTGATLDACARVLLTSGAASVVAVTVARED
jgi:ComF family protein